MADNLTLNEKTIAELVKIGRLSSEVRNIGNTPFVVIPNDCKVTDLSAFVNNNRAEHPIRKHGTVKVLDGESFCEYYRLFSDVNSRVFADETSSKILAVLDYHGAGDGRPRWGEHRIDFTLRFSEEWKTWTANDGKKITQMEFAEFIEDNTPDIVTPAAASMLEMARDLRAKTDVDFGSAIRLNNGSVQFKYTEQVKGTYGAGNLDVPEQFTISVPVYIGSQRVNVQARLRYRINSGKLTFWFDLLRADLVERQAFLAELAAVSEALKITVIHGSPA